ncbi:helix-turn-helix transcriptional regulator [Serratia fonticola]|uniref:helix-turn-helix transcriptional regulator n=1 Tax=Serratia fonticola TaxID=47917 RepID=UPI0036F3385A
MLPHNVFLSISRFELISYTYCVIFIEIKLCGVVMNNIAVNRKKLGLSQSALASLIGWTTSRLSNYEIEIRTPSLDDSRLIVSALNSLGAEVTLDDIFPPQAA